MITDNPVSSENIWRNVSTLQGKDFNAQITNLRRIYKLLQKESSFLTDLCKHAPAKFEAWKTLIVNTLRSSIEKLSRAYINGPTLDFSLELNPSNLRTDQQIEAFRERRDFRDIIATKISLFEELKIFAREKSSTPPLSEQDRASFKDAMSQSAPVLISYPGAVEIFLQLSSALEISIAPITLDEQQLAQCDQLCKEGRVAPEKLPIVEGQKK